MFKPFHRHQADPIVAAWQTCLSGTDGPLAGAELIDRRTLPHAVAYTLTRPAEQTTVTRHRQRIAAVLRREPHTVVIDTDQAGARLLLLDNTVLTQPIAHPGTSALDPATGLVTIGVHGDGQPATWTLWSAGGAHPGVIIGGTPTERASVLAGLAAATTDHPRIHWHVDPTGQTRLDGADRSAHTDDDIGAMLGDLIRLIHQRNQQLANHGIRCWRPDDDGPPLLLVTIAAGDRVLADTSIAGRQRVALLENILMLARKLGVSPTIALNAGHWRAFGHSSPLRDALIRVNALHLGGDDATGGYLDPDDATPGLPWAEAGYLRGNPLPLRLFTAPSTQPVTCP